MLRLRFQHGFLNKSFQKDVCDYKKRVSARAEIASWFVKPRAGNFSPVKRPKKNLMPGLKYELGRAHPFSCACKTLSWKFSRPILNTACARAETRHVIATKLQPGKRTEISARAKIRHVIGALDDNFKNWQHWYHNAFSTVKLFSPRLFSQIKGNGILQSKSHQLMTSFQLLICMQSSPLHLCGALIVS